MEHGEHPSGSTRLGPAVTGGLCDIELQHPAGTFAPTPASFIAMEAIGRHADRLRGTGLDWGSGIGCLALVAAHIPAVDRVVGLELDRLNVEIARANAERCGLADKVRFLHADSYAPLEPNDRRFLATLEGSVEFILANPPSSSPADDGFSFRRTVIRDAPRFLREGGLIFLNVSKQYGMDRVLALLELAPGQFEYGGILATTDWVPFDMTRPDLMLDVRSYAAEEARGGRRYDFRHPDDATRVLSAGAALAHFLRTGRSPLSCWQTHLFIRTS